MAGGYLVTITSQEEMAFVYSLIETNADMWNLVGSGHGPWIGAFQAPGSWRWTFKIKGKTACVALSEEQATQMSQAIDNHRRLEEIVREMREITQSLILETVPGVRRRKPISEIPKAH